MKKNLAEIADIIHGKLEGDENILITGLSGIDDADEGDLTFISNPKYMPLAQKTKAAAIIVSFDAQVSGKPVIRVDNPSFAFSEVISQLSKEDESFRWKGVHPTAVIGKNVVLGKNVSIGPHVIINDQCHLGDHTCVEGGCYIGHQTRIGDHCLIYPNVSIRERVTIGDRVIIHSGAVIGSDGFGFEKIDGRHKKIPQIGTVVIGDDVDIGANVTIDRARIDKTVIGRGCKIDNLVQIAHNVVMGEDCIIISQVGISGTTIIGNDVILAGQVGVTGHLTIGEGTIVASKSAVTKDTPPHSKVWGIPARPLKQAFKVNACVQKLPKQVKTIQELKKRIERLEKQFSEMNKS